MNESTIIQSDLQTYVDDFSRHCLAQEEAVHKEYNSKKGNQHARKRIRAFTTLTEKYGDQGRESLSVLLHDDHPRVRCMAAAFLLRYKHEEAMEVLRDLVARKELGQSFPAFQSMKNWESGDWQLDPGPQESD